MTRLLATTLFIVFHSAFCGKTSFAQTPRVYRDRVEPHWIENGAKFWYRNQLPNRRSEFILVDPAAATRGPAFDHERIATALSQKTGKRVSGQQLPVMFIEFADDMSTVTLTGRGTRWVVDLTTYQVKDENSENETPAGVKFFMPPRKSVDRGGDIEFLVKNELETEVQLVWIDRNGERQSYGTIEAGKQRTQHTFVGHVWLLTSSKGEAIVAFEVSNDNGEVVVNEQTGKAIRARQKTLKNAGSKKQSQKPAGLSPDASATAYIANHNLWIKSINGERFKEPVALTTNATSMLTFRKDASRARLINMQYARKDSTADVGDVHWSPDSRYLLAVQTRTVPETAVYYIESSPKGRLQPQLKSYPYAKPGDPIPASILRLFHVDEQHEIVISDELFANPYDLRFLKWNDDGSRFWLRYNERGHQALRILEVTAIDGKVRAVIDERSDTFIHYSDGGKNVLEWLPERQVLWASERSGWNHLYRYDIESGTVINAVTNGEWNVRRIESIDRDSQQIWFYAVGIAAEQDPYHEHFCRVNFDGTELKVLTQGNGTHEVSFSPDRSLFFDRYSRVDLPPVTELRSSDDGHVVVTLETSDASEIIADRGCLPKRFHAKGRDGTTDIWGIIHLPRHFDPKHRYPIVENIYAGPHDHHVPKAFRNRYRHQQQIADRGMIVVQIDGMGTAWRSKNFHDVCYKNLKDGGFPDRISWMLAAAEQFPWMDVSRVGIYGGSAGGQNAVAALLWHGTFYKAAVADCGCHDNRMDKLWWNEQWMGLPGDGSYVSNSNMENAHRLQGKLLLVVGELDRNVDPASTTQVIGKLIEADKDFDFLLVPGAGHGACERPYGSRRRADFLARHLRAGQNIYDNR